MSASPPPGVILDDQAIRRLREPKPPVDPWHSHGSLDELERRLDGSLQRCRTVFLAGAECPFTCVFCDLWRFTTDAPTPPGALPKQIEAALADGAKGIDCLKLFNASNFFEPRAVPPQDLPAIARLAGETRVVVECHPRLVGRGCLEFAARLDGRLELALGLETAHPDALQRLNKKMSLEDFDRACDFARQHALGLRAFVLIGAPYVPSDERRVWIEASVRHAVAQGVDHITLIPLRSGSLALQELAAAGQFQAPTAQEIEQSFSSAQELGAGRSVVTLDLWDIERHFAGSPCCAGDRIARLQRLNLSGTAEPPVICVECGGGR